MELFFKKKEFLDVKLLDSQRNLKFFNIVDKFNVHFVNKVPFQFLGRFNFAFDCFIMAINFVLYLTYHFFYLIFGSGLKSRISLPFYKFYRWFPLKLNTTTLRFWMDLKFLVFDSYSINPFIFKSFNFSYFSYFPLTFFYSIFEFSSSIFSRFSLIARESSSYINKFYRRQHSFFFDLDFHISLFLGKGVIRIKIPGLLNFFRYKIQEYYIVHGLEKSALSLIQVNNEQRIMVPVYPFFKKRFFFIFLNKMKNVFVSNLFGFFKFFFFICKNLSIFFSFLIFKKLNKFFFFFIFFRLYYFFFIKFYFFKFFNKFIKNLLFFKFFIFEFFYFFFKKHKKFNKFFILNLNFILKFFILKFFNFVYFFFSLDFFKFNINLPYSSNKILFSFSVFSNLILLKFNTSFLDNFFNPLALVYNSGFSKLSGHNAAVFSKYFVNFLDGRPFYLFFCFFVFIRFFLFLFFFLFKSNFIKFSCDFDFFSSRFFFFRLFTIMLSFFRIFTYKRK